MLATETELFVWDKDYKNDEQVRLYLADFNRLYDELTSSGEHRYDISFAGRIPGLAGSQNEKTGIYMLRNMRSRSEDHAKVDAFITSGGKPVSESDLFGRVARGTLMVHGWYVGGTGYREIEDVRVTMDNGNGSSGSERVLFKQPRQKNWRLLSSALGRTENCYFRAA